MLICKSRKKSLEVEVQETEENARDKDTKVAYVDVTCDELLKEPIMILDECSIVTSVSDQPYDEVSTLVQDKIQSIMRDASAQESVMFPNISVPIHIPPASED